MMQNVEIKTYRKHFQTKTGHDVYQFVMVDGKAQLRYD